MLIGTTVIGLEKILRLIRLNGKQSVRAEESKNQNIFELLEDPAAEEKENAEMEAIQEYILNMRKITNKDKDDYISWFASMDIQLQANSNAINEAIREQSFAEKIEAQKNNPANQVVIAGKKLLP